MPSCPICRQNSVRWYSERHNHQLYDCSQCRILFVWPMPEEVANIYSADYYQSRANEKTFGYSDYEQDKEPMRRIFEEYLQRLEKIAPTRNIFDIGTATGYFLDLAKRDGWQTAGVEISAYAARQAADKGHRIWQGELPQLKIEGEFGVVTMWDVLEHLRDPHSYLQEINRLLLPQGLLLINTIDRQSLWARLWGRYWNMIIPPEHLVYYSSIGLKRLLEENGFVVLEQRKLTKSFSLAYIFKVLYNWQGIRMWQKLSHYFDNPRWRRFKIPINLRDNIFVLAQKQTDVADSKKT